MAALGDRPAAEVTTREINAAARPGRLAGASPRTVNKHRQLVCAIYSYGCQEATFALAHNPATAADRRPEPEPARLDFFSPEEVEALARALADGLPPRPRCAGGERRGGRRARRRRPPGRRAGAGRRVHRPAPRRAGRAALARRRLPASQARRSARGQRGRRSVSTKSRRAREVPLPTRPPARSTACRSAATSRAPTTTSSPTASAAASTARRCAAASSAPATPPASARCGSTTCGTPTARCSSPAASTWLR